MAVEGDVWQRFVTSLVSSGEEAKQSGDSLSAEDAAWVDSCLVRDPEGPELLDDNWDAFKDAILDLVTLQSTQEVAASETEGFSKAVYDNHDPMSEESPTLDFLGTTEDDLVPIHEKAETDELFGATDDDDDLSPTSKKTEAAKFRGYFRKGFLSNYRDIEDKEDNDVEVDMDSNNEIDSSSENIFKVWDLDTWTEEDELVQELRKALAGNSVDAPETLDDSFSGKGKETLDDLISRIADLSLHPSSS